MKTDNQDSSESRLDGLFAQYRAACPEPEAGPEFMPGLWRRIEARRKAPLFLFRRWAEVCMVATAAGALIISMLLIPRFQRAPVYQTHYVDALASADSSQDAMALLDPAVQNGIFE